MRRRSILAACATGIVVIAGCSRGSEPAGESTPETTTTAASPGHPNPKAAFRAAVERLAADYVETVSLEGEEWRVAYAVEVCCGEPFKAHQAALARNFSAVRPENVSLTVTSFHESLNINWEIPAALARNHRTGQIDTDTYVSRIQNTTTRESQS